MYSPINMRFRYKKSILIFTIAALIPAGFACAAELPDMMVGQTTVTSGGIDFYGGMGGNFAVYNYNAGDNYGFRKENLELGKTCQGDLGTVPPAINPCFDLGNLVNVNPYTFLSSPGKLLTSRTKIKAGSTEKIVLETPALYYGQNVILGDAYIGSGLTNFEYWGKNLGLSKDAAKPDSFWGVGGYQMNQDAQAKLSGSEYVKFASKIDRATGEATPTGAIAGASNLFLEANDINIAPNSSGIYPEGKVWKVDGAGNLTITSDVTYSGKGTIIVPGDLTINSGKDITAFDDNGRLGFIVKGSVTIKGNNEIEAAILSYSNINVNGNTVTLTGSFAAKDFPNLSSRSNIIFKYDYGFDTAWPPIFGDLIMPSAKER